VKGAQQAKGETEKGKDVDVGKGRKEEKEEEEGEEQEEEDEQEEGKESEDIDYLAKYLAMLCPSANHAKFLLSYFYYVMCKDLSKKEVSSQIV